MKRRTKFITLSNRLPVSLHRKEGRWEVRPGSGGLVTAMAPVLRNRGGTWIGWPGAEGAGELQGLIESASSGVGYNLVPVFLSRQEVNDYYSGFSNQVLWPLFHGLQSYCDFSPNFWYAYLVVNAKFAKTTAEQSGEEDYIWVHDYHLMGVATALKEMKVRRKTGFFLHIPFPPLETFVRLPWRSQILKFLIDYDLVGFQTMGDRRNFLDCLQRLLPGVRTSGRGPVITVTQGDRAVRVGAFPISIDYGDFVRKATGEIIERRQRVIRDRFSGQTIMLGLDRMDYTKGMKERLRAVQDALRRYPQLRSRLTLVQVLVPSRRTLKRYMILKARVDRLIGEINGEFASMDWAPIQYHYRSLTGEELLSYYRAADIALVTPVKDGMNLVAKEYCACNVHHDGVLILSEFAGSAAQFQSGALLVNPHDREGTADAIYEAFSMGREERKRRMRKLRESVRKQNIFWWVDSFLQAAFARHLDDFAPVEEYFPDITDEPGPARNGS